MPFHSTPLTYVYHTGLSDDCADYGGASKEGGRGGGMEGKIDCERAVEEDYLYSMGAGKRGRCDGEGLIIVYDGFNEGNFSLFTVCSECKLCTLAARREVD